MNLKAFYCRESYIIYKSKYHLNISKAIHANYRSMISIFKYKNLSFKQNHGTILDILNCIMIL